MKLFNIADFKKYSPLYIESGTCQGASLNRAMKADFYELKSIEADEKLYHFCCKRFNYFTNIRLYFGTSEQILPIILSNVYQQAVIFLDAHPAGVGTAGHNDLMEKGVNSEFQQDRIINKELEIILNHRPDHIIIIDDQNGPNFENDRYMRKMLAINPDYEFEFYDEMLEDGILHSNKILVCIPKMA